MDNKFYRTDISKFDPTKASAEDIRKWLFAIIDAELDKDPSERDYDLIEECAAFEVELPEFGIEASESELAARLERIKALAPASEPGETKIIKTKKKTQKTVRIVAILAASLAVLLLSVTVAAAIKGVSLIGLLLGDKKDILEMEPGEKVEEESITLVRNGELISYSSLEEVVLNTGYDILYPSYLPDGVKIDRVVVTDVGNEKVQIIFKTNIENLWIDIINPPITSEENLKKLDKYNNGEVDFYIFGQASYYQAYLHYGNMEYSIMHNNYDELINILNGMKELEK